MTDNERLVRIDERTANTYHLVEKQESHLEKLNGTIAEHAEAIAVIQATCKERHPKYSNIKRVGADAGLIGIIIALVEALKLLIGKV